ncbi:MAG: uroporphyrinogen decarboxylase family protein [Bryobacteraceae bacterium]
MTSRERVLTAIAHKEPGRVPIDQGSMRSTGIMAIAYNRLKRHLGVDGPPTFMYDLVQQLAQPDDWFLERFSIDVIDLGRALSASDPRVSWILPDGSTCTVPAWYQPERRAEGCYFRNQEGVVVGQMPAGALYMDQAVWPLCGPEGLDDYEPLPEKMALVTWAAIPAAGYDHPLTEARLDFIAATARRLREESSLAVSMSVGCNLFEWSQFLFGMENTYCYIAGEKKKYARFLDRLTEIHLENLARLLPRVRGAVDVLVVGDDLGMQSGPQMSRQSYRELFLPRHKRIYEFARRESGAHIFMHNCGGVYPLIPDLIEAGVEILNPVQTSARQMEPERLKREFGRDLTFWGGGCDTQHILRSGTPDEVREDVRRRLEIWMKDGGYVFNQVHNALADVPPGNYVAMLEAAREFGAY